MSPAQSASTLLLSQFFPRSPSVPAHTSRATTCRRPLRHCSIVCANSSGRVIKRRSTDDYHATLKALNSKARFPRKSLGQHYMLSNEINEKLVSVAGVEEGDVVLEIGPGTGSLTNILINAGATILAVEKDPHMASLVRERFSGIDKLKVLQEDFVKCHVRSHMTALLESVDSDVNPKRAKVVANIPFNITKDVVKLLLPMGSIFSEVVLLVQEETAVRLVSPSLRTPEYRSVNVFVDFYSEDGLLSSAQCEHFLTTSCTYLMSMSLNWRLMQLLLHLSSNKMPIILLSPRLKPSSHWLILHSMVKERCCGDHCSTYVLLMRSRKLLMMPVFHLVLSILHNITHEICMLGMQVGGALCGSCPNDVFPHVFGLVFGISTWCPTKPIQ